MRAGNYSGCSRLVRHALSTELDHYPGHVAVRPFEPIESLEHESFVRPMPMVGRHAPRERYLIPITPSPLDILIIIEHGPTVDVEWWPLTHSILACSRRRNQISFESILFLLFPSLAISSTPISITVWALDCPHAGPRQTHITTGLVHLNKCLLCKYLCTHVMLSLYLVTSQTPL